MSLFQRIPDPANEARTYSPVFHILEDYSYWTRKAQHSPSNGMSTPGFDVRETGQAYEVHADLPGIAQDSLSIEFTGENTLTISGHKDRRPITSASSDSGATSEADQEAEWQHIVNDFDVNSIDAATTGPLPGQRRTSLVDAQKWQAPAENIDHATTGESRRRDSIRDSKSWQHPTQNIDAYSHHDATHSAAVDRHNRRSSIIDAKNWRQPRQSIDGATTGPAYDPTSALLSAAVKPFSSPRSLPRNSIDAATAGSRRSNTTVCGPWVPRSRRNSPPWLVEERPAGAFAREIRFPTAVSREGVMASLKDGALTVVVPKRPLEERTKVTVSVL